MKKKKAILVIKQQITSLNYLCSTVWWRVDLETNEIGYLTEEISKQRFEEAANPIYEASTLMT